MNVIEKLAEDRQHEKFSAVICFSVTRRRVRQFAILGIELASLQGNSTSFPLSMLFRFLNDQCDG